MLIALSSGAGGGIRTRLFQFGRLTCNRKHFTRLFFGYPPGTRTPTNGFGDRGAAITPVSNYGFFGECGTSNTNVILSTVPLFHAE